MNILNHLTTLVNGFSASEAAGAIAVIMGVLVRIIPTSKPMCILLFIGAAAQSVSEFAISLSGALNKVIPQNMSTPTQAPVSTATPAA
jgi:hypothetical protein